MSIGHDMQTEKVDYLDLSEFCLVQSGTTIRETIATMRQKETNCAFILRDGALAGIFTDRDVMRRVVDRPDIWEHAIDEVMTHGPRAVESGQSVGEAVSMMDDLHFRNVPVRNSDGKITGNLTHFSLIRYLADNFQNEILNLPPTPDQFGRQRAGG
jgi:CBS domain-containing protein